jgi:hypothetical protein
MIKDEIKIEEELSGKFTLLGVFLYVHFVVKILAANDESEFVVILVPYTNATIIKNRFSDLSLARSQFEEIVHCCLHDTSLSDVSIFMQQHDGV